VLVIESWTLGALSQTAPGSAVVRPLTAAPEVDGWAITERPLKDLTRLGDRVWLVADDVHELGPADAGRHLELLVMRGPLEASSCSAQELTAPDTEQSSHGPRAMIAGMGKAQPPGPDSRVDNPQDVEVTGDLPMSLTTFVGRERELDELRSLFREGKRLVTLVGIGGIGKTRLALELGFSAGDLGWAKVYLVELASLANPGLVDGAVLESVGGGSSRSPLQAAVEYLRQATALLVLDCCEHVLNAARHVAEVLLRGCPSVAILATSRSPLDIAGELVWPVPPLSSMQKRSDAGEARASDAARLFLSGRSWRNTKPARGSAQGGGSYRLRGHHPLVLVVLGTHRFLGRGPGRRPRSW
jgi:hypothetical protein